MFFELAAQALVFHENAFRSLQSSDAARHTAFLILIAAGFSRTAGQSLVLFVNKVRPFHFIMSLGANVLIYCAGVFFWSIIIWIASTLYFKDDMSLTVLFAVASLGHAPYLFGFLSLTPYLGAAWERILGVWTLMCIILGLLVTLQLPFYVAVITGLAGWGLSYILDLLFGPLINRLVKFIVKTAAGRSLDLTTDNLLGELQDWFSSDDHGRPSK